jgi:hypothetical protein
MWPLHHDKLEKRKWLKLISGVLERWDLTFEICRVLSLCCCPLALNPVSVTDIARDYYFVVFACGVHPIHNRIDRIIVSKVDCSHNLEYIRNNIVVLFCNDCQSLLTFKNPAGLVKFRIEQDICSIWLGRPLMTKEQYLDVPVLPAMGVMVPLAAVDIAWRQTADWSENEWFWDEKCNLNR